MNHSFLKAVLVAGLIMTPTTVTAAATTKSKTTNFVSAAACIRCRSLAEGIDTSKASKAREWSGLVIGINLGSHDIIITEANKLDHIKAFQQRNIIVDGDTKIITEDGEDKTFNDIDIGYRIEVEGSYNTKKRTIIATRIRIVDVAVEPVVKTK